jgi:hypothetical protein
MRTSKETPFTMLHLTKECGVPYPTSLLWFTLLCCSFPPLRALLFVGRNRTGLTLTENTLLSSFGVKNFVPFFNLKNRWRPVWVLGESRWESLSVYFQEFSGIIIIKFSALCYKY